MDDLVGLVTFSVFQEIHSRGTTAPHLARWTGTMMRIMDNAQESTKAVGGSKIVTNAT